MEDFDESQVIKHFDDNRHEHVDNILRLIPKKKKVYSVGYLDLNYDYKEQIFESEHDLHAGFKLYLKENKKPIFVSIETIVSMPGSHKYKMITAIPKE